jgi:hypothetical protein
LLYLKLNLFLRSILHLTPVELHVGRKPSVSHLRPFGCKCFVLKCGNIDKFESCSFDGICLDTPFMADLTEFTTLKITPLLSHVV